MFTATVRSQSIRDWVRNDGEYTRDERSYKLVCSLCAGCVDLVCARNTTWIVTLAQILKQSEMYVLPTKRVELRHRVSLSIAINWKSVDSLPPSA